MYCNTNIMRYTSRKILEAIDSTNYDNENEVGGHELQIESEYDQASAWEALYAPRWCACLAMNQGHQRPTKMIPVKKCALAMAGVFGVKSCSQSLICGIF